MVEPMTTTGVIELFPFSCKSPKNEPYRNRYLLGNGGTKIAGVIELFPFSCKSPKKIESSGYLVNAKKWFIINMTQEWKPLALFDQSICNICL